MRGHKRSDGLISDYCDSKAYSNHPLFSLHPDALQIMLYYDDVEVCNPIGSRAKIHKLGRLNCSVDYSMEVTIVNSGYFYLSNVQVFF